MVEPQCEAQQGQDSACRSRRKGKACGPMRHADAGDIGRDAMRGDKPPAETFGQKGDVRENAVPCPRWSIKATSQAAG